MGAHFFGVRHHSPAAARHVGELIRELRPGVVLIEGPHDFNPRMDELRLSHEPPIAIYTWIVLPDGSRRGAYYPLCVYSPEWQAIRAGFEVGAEVRFIDLPWADLADANTALHRYGDGEFRGNPYIAKLCMELGVDGFDDAWDRIFEVDGAIPRAEWIERCHLLCRQMRESGPISPRDTLRERFMACRVREALEAGQGEVLVLTGAYHTSAIEALLEGDCEDVSLSPPQQGEGRGICLMPYSYEVLDSLRGYDAGMPNPGFYHRIWEERSAGRGDAYRRLLADIVSELRERKQLVSAADLIAVETTARALAALRGHAEVWRLDLLDGITGALVKEEIDTAMTHPLLAACHDALRGAEVGKLAEGTPLPALVLEVKERLEKLELTLTATRRQVRLDLHEPVDLERAMLLHSLLVLEIPGFALRAGPADSAPTALERWTLAWQPAFEARLVESSAYGATLIEACAARLMERAKSLDRNALKAARLLRDACLAGIDSVQGIFAARLSALVQGDADFGRISAAAGEILSLYRYDPLLQSIGRDDIGDLLGGAWERGLLLLTTLGVPEEPSAAVNGVRILLEVFERSGEALNLPRSALVGAFERTTTDREQLATIRGAALGALWILGARESQEVEGTITSFAAPGELGDFLTGLFATARELARRHPSLVQEVDGAVLGFEDGEFLEALPALRLAFSTFSPREKHHLVQSLFAATGQGAASGPDLQVDTDAATEMLRFETELFEQVRRFGLRGER